MKEIIEIVIMKELQKIQVKYKLGKLTSFLLNKIWMGFGDCPLLPHQ